ncbi:hypothetical protein AVEN_217953-1, partial [Araneus ventricosus]
NGQIVRERDWLYVIRDCVFPPYSVGRGKTMNEAMKWKRGGDARDAMGVSMFQGPDFGRIVTYIVIFDFLSS